MGFEICRAMAMWIFQAIAAAGGMEGMEGREGYKRTSEEKREIRSRFLVTRKVAK